MIFTITGKHIEITEAIKQYVEEKTSKLPRYYNSINRIEVIIDAGPGGNTFVEIIASAEHGHVFVASETHGDAYRCIDTVVRKLERQLKRKKTRQRDSHKHTDNPEPNTTA